MIFTQVGGFLSLTTIHGRSVVFSLLRCACKVHFLIVLEDRIGSGRDRDFLCVMFGDADLGQDTFTTMPIIVVFHTIFGRSIFS